MVYLYFAKQIGIAIAFAVWAYIIAKGLFTGTSNRLSPVEEVALLVPAGLAVAMVLLFALGLAGALTAPGIVTSAGLALGLAGWRLRYRHRSTSRPSGTVPAIAHRESAVRLAMILFACTALIPVALRGLTPPMISDEVRYHLPYALHFVEQGRIVPDLYLRYPFHTLNVNLLYAVALIFGDDVTPHYIHLLLGCIAGLALYVLAVPKCGRIVAFCAVMLFFLTPTFFTKAPTAMVDFGLAAFVTTAIACLDRARGRHGLVACAGLAFGAALGTKYLALALFPLLVAWAAYRTRAGLQTARFAVVAMLTGAPWYIYNIVWTGNPISPFAGEWFGSWPWTAEDLARQTRELTRESSEHSLFDLVSLPYHLVFESHRFRTPPVPVLLGFGLMSLVLLPWWNSKIRPYGILMSVVLTGWFFTSSIFRYLAAILPVWCLISAWSVERAFRLVASRVAFRRVTPGTVRRRATYAAAATMLVLAHYHTWRYYSWPDTDAVTEWVVHRDRFLRREIPVYGVFEYLRQSGTHGEVILAFPPGALLSYARENRIVGDWHGPMSARLKLEGASLLCPERLIERLHGVSLLVLSRDYLRRRPYLDRYVASQPAFEYADAHSIVLRVESGGESSQEDRTRNSTVAPRAPVAVGDSNVHVLPYFPVASSRLLQGIVRIVNHSDEAGTVAIHGIDDAGRRYGPANLALGAGKALHFTSADWVSCNFVNRVSGGLGENEAGSWWISLVTDLDIEVSGYAHTRDTVTTSLHEVVRTTQGSDDRTIHHVPFFFPGNERSQASHLRLVNPGDRDVAVTIAGRDDAGETAGEEIRLSLPGGRACWLSASVLESGTPDRDGSGCEIISGRLGTGRGGWRLSVAASGGDIQVMSLLANPTGHPTNLSASGGVGSDAYTLPLFLPVPDSIEEPQGLARIVNHSDAAGTVEIHGIDDAGTSHGPVTLTLDGQEAVNLGSIDLEAGNASKGLPEGLGDGDGYWRLRLATELKIEALAYVRKQGEIVTSTHEAARTTRGGKGEIVHYVPFFNPGRNVREVSWLRLSNSGRRDVEVTIEGHDDVGAAAPKGAVGLTLPAGQACMLSAQALESGKPESGSDTCTGERFDFDGRLGEGIGEWSLFVTTRGGDVQVMGLLESFTGHLTNMSIANRVPAGSFHARSRPRSRGQDGPGDAS